MKLLKLEQITGNEILAKAILTSDYKELLSEGTQVRLSYIPKLKEVGVTEIFVKDNELDAQTRLILKADVNKRCKEKVQQVLSMHTYKDGEDMTEIAKTADNIINVISNDDNVARQVYDIKERSADLYEHCISTCTIAILVAIKMKLSWTEIHDLGVGCILHDIGLRYVTVDYVDRDIDEMSRSEKEDYLKHPIYGYTAIREEEWINKVSKEIILMHHENLDGSGYPLHTNQVHITTKIAAVCDLFDEMICGVGRKRRKVYEVIEYLKAYKGIRFDANIIDVLLDFTAVYPSGNKVLLNTGEIAIVVNQNKGFPERPMVQLVMNQTGVVYDKIEVRNLLEYPNIFIDKVLN